MARTLKSSGGKFLMRPLNVLFGAPGHVSILRALARAGRGLTGRETARAAGVAQRAGLDGLGRLENAGVVRRIPAGRAFLFELRRDNRLVRDGILPLLEAEAAIRSGVFERLKKAVEKHVVSAWIFGSAARGEETVESDLDVLLLVERREDVEAAQRRMSTVFEGLRKEFDVRPSLMVMTKAEFVSGYRTGKSFMRNVVEDAETIAGKSPRAVLDGR
jgi:predicted nucleotidyltransferase